MAREAGPKPVPEPQADTIPVEAEAEIVTDERRIPPVENTPVPEALAAERIRGFEAGTTQPEHIDTEPIVPIIMPPAQTSGDSTRTNQWFATIALLTLALVAGSYAWFRWNYVEQPLSFMHREFRAGSSSAGHPLKPEPRRERLFASGTATQLAPSHSLQTRG
jgi:hypothetical protein